MKSRRMMAMALSTLVAAGMALTGCVPLADGDANESVSSVPSHHDDRLDSLGIKKPVLYLYPEEHTEVSVCLANPSRITSSYPEYDDGWHVHAAPDGMLIDDETGRSLYALYYEALKKGVEELGDEGFVVQRDELIPFLEEKLGVLGLTEREAEEMIVYWLPQMQGHDACYVRFSLTDEEQQQNELRIAPAPDHLIRIRMIWKGLDDSEAKDVAGQIHEQKMVPVDRNSLDGFIAVEWGGTEIGSQKDS